jgi:formylglycine-generating enzyme required for sulfatase activity
MTAKPDSNRIQKLLKNFTKEKFVGMSGLALLCGATVFALSGDPGAALLGSVGSNVLAAVLQQHFEKVRDLPNADEQERLAVFARSLTPEISNNKGLQEAVGAFVDANHTFDIALALVDENPQVHGWLLTKIYSDVRAYRHDFDRIHEEIAHLISLVKELQNDEQDEAAFRAYLEMIARRTRHLPLGPLDPKGRDSVQLSLAKLFVNLDVNSTIFLPNYPRQPPAYRLVENAIGHVAYQSQLILLGDPGSGKSTLLRYLAYAFSQALLWPEQNWLSNLTWTVRQAEADEDDLKAINWFDGRIFQEKLEKFWGNEFDDHELKEVEEQWTQAVPVPIFIELRDFARTNFDPQSPTALWQFVQNQLEQNELVDAVPDLRRRGLASELIFLLDGVDEVPLTERPAIWQAIKTMLAGPYGGNQWIATCRVLSFDADEAPPNVQNRTIQPLAEGRIDQFVAGWYAALSGAGELKQEEAQQMTERLQQATRRTGLQPLAQNPMLLTIMALVQTYHGALPDERARLYQACVETLLLRWQRHKEGEGEDLPSVLAALGIKQTDLERLLWQIAWEAHSKAIEREDAADIPEWNVLQIVREALGSLSKAEQFLEYTERRAHLLVARGGLNERVYTFPHRTFQEYLAACQLASGRRFGREAAKLAAQGDLWREVLSLATGTLVFNQNNREKALDGVEQVLPEQTPLPEDEAGWRRVWLAGEMMLVVGLEAAEKDDVGQELLPNLCQQMGDLLTAGALTPQQRSEVGELLAKLGEMRPDVACEVPETVEVPAGSFLMGSDKIKDKYVMGDETPQHEVTLPAYRIGKYPVTNAQFARFVQAGGYANEAYWTKAGWAERKKQGWTEPRHSDNPRFNQANQPVVGVSWYEAMAYCNWLKVTTGRDFRLPNEAMWEKAARGTQGQIYSWGDEWDAAKLNTTETSINRPSAVGIFPAGKSPYEAFDMCGNVWEWCSTVHGEQYPFREVVYEKEVDGLYPRRLRGGAFSYDERYCRTAFQGIGDSGGRENDVGFRVAENLPVVDT